MRLTTLQRFKDLYRIGIDSKGNVSPNTKEDVEISRAIDATSANIENYLKRNIKLQTYTEHFSPIPGQFRFNLRAYPVVSITKVETDSTGRYTGSQVELDPDSYIIAENGKTLVLDRLLAPWNSSKSLRVTYYGGIASSPDITEVSLSSELISEFEYEYEADEIISEGDVIIGQSSGAKATFLDSRTVTNDDDSETYLLRMRNVYGIFEEGEDLVIYTDSTDDSQTLTNTIETIESQSLAEAAPDLVLACEYQTRYYYKHQSDFENNSTDTNAQTRRGPNGEKGFLQEVKDLLDNFINRSIDAQNRSRR